jgi:hypothetical protein
MKNFLRFLITDMHTFIIDVAIWIALTGLLVIEILWIIGLAKRTYRWMKDE